MQVLVLLVPLTQYVQDDPAQANVQVFYDAEVKIFCTNSVEDATIKDDVSIIHKTALKLLLGTFNMAYVPFLEAKSNSWFSVYYYDTPSQSLKYLDLDRYDSLLEAIVEAGEYNISFPRQVGQDVVPACPYVYVCIDGRRFDPRMTWFYSGNQFIECHALRIFPWGKVESNKGKTTWIPLEMYWYDTVPEHLAIPSRRSRKGTSPFWKLR